MSEHLEIERYLAGDRTAAAEQHLVECAECRDDVARMESVLAQFRVNAHLWGRAAVSRGLVTRLSPPANCRATWWFALATAVLLFASVPMYRGYTERQAAAQAKADAALLDEIGADISRPAPQTLEPLIDLVSTEGARR
jgi:hypothetical protein